MGTCTQCGVELTDANKQPQTRKCRECYKAYHRAKTKQAQRRLSEGLRCPTCEAPVSYDSRSGYCRLHANTPEAKAARSMALQPEDLLTNGEWVLRGHKRVWVANATPMHSCLECPEQIPTDRPRCSRCSRCQSRYLSRLLIEQERERATKRAAARPTNHYLDPALRTTCDCGCLISKGEPCPNCQAQKEIAA